MRGKKQIAEGLSHGSAVESGYRDDDRGDEVELVRVS